MRLNDDYIVHETDGQQVLIDTAGTFSGLVRNNKTAAFIVECLTKETTLDNIVDKIYEKYDAPKDVIKNDVISVIDKLRTIGAIIE